MADVENELNKLTDFEIADNFTGAEATWFRLAGALNLRVSEKARFKTFTSSSNFNVPTGLLYPYALVLGFGGGGGAGSGGGNFTTSSIVRGGSGGVGGSGAGGRLIWVPITPGGTVTVTIGAGGSGGARVGPTQNGRAGTDGGSTYFGGYRFLGGRGGPGGRAWDLAQLQAVGVSDLDPNPRHNALNLHIPGGGTGNTGDSVSPPPNRTSSASGADSHFASGGAAGSDGLGNGRAGAGGGGGAGFGSGGIGASAVEFNNGGGLTGGSAAANTGGGGGGGSGEPGSASVFLSGAGGVGGSGILKVLYYAESEAV